jgi:hypothetical protein
MADATQGYEGEVCLDDTAVDANSYAIEFLRCSLRKTTEIIETNAIRGTRSHPKETSREGISRIAGQLAWNPSPLDLDQVLPWILGAAESTDTFALADTLPNKHVGVNYGADAFEYQDCYVNKATFSAAVNGFLELELDLIGKAQADLTYPTLTIGVTANDEPYRFVEGVLTLASSARDIMSVKVEIDNSLDARFTNSNNATSITPQDRIITLSVTTPYTSGEVDLFTQSLAGAAASLVFTNGNLSLTFTFANLEPAPLQGPQIGGKSEIQYEQVYIARMSGSTKELVVTNDSVSAS